MVSDADEIDRGGCVPHPSPMRDASATTGQVPPRLSLYLARLSERHTGERALSADEDLNADSLAIWETHLQSFSLTGLIKIKLAAPTAEIFKNLARQCWTSKNRLVESRPIQFCETSHRSPREAPHNTMVESAEKPPSCYRRRPPGPLQRLHAASSRLCDGFCRLMSVSLRPRVIDRSADRRFEHLSVSPLCLSLAGSISLSPARAYRVWLAATVRAGQLLPLQFLRRFPRR